MNTGFMENLENPRSSAIIDLSHQGKPLLIVFGGKKGGMGIPPFEFFNVTKDLCVNKIYLRDLRQAWYQSGLQGISGSINETATYLRGKIIESGARKVVVFGNSMGGYAAILFGVLIEADIVHSFVPKTFINEIINEEKIKNAFDEFLDLKVVIKSKVSGCKVNIYYDPDKKIANKHAMNLKSLKNVVLHPIKGGGHGLIRHLRDSGELRKIISSSLINDTQ